MRRICTQADLTLQDTIEITQNLRAAHSLCEEGTFDCLREDHLKLPLSNEQEVTALTSISEVQNANRLAGGQSLVFANSGITLIYGYNGSGKTGYARIIKQVCRTRDEQRGVLANVFVDATFPPASASISYKTDEEEFSTVWIDGLEAPKALNRISVFDSSTAPLYADKQNRIEFLPAGLDVLPRLGKLCESLSEDLEEEIAELEKFVTGPLPKVRSKKFLTQLEDLQCTSTGPLPSASSLEAEFCWTALDDPLLLELENKIQALSAPDKVLAQIARFKATFEILKSKVENLLLLLSREGVEAFSQLIEEARETRKAAEIASEGRFSEDPLKDAPLSEWMEKSLSKCRVV
ncbi:hypothetical protein SAMN05443244_1768 [Terriglobus roseus]|uniref:AAA domain-containing protein n=2 Tax=Terriglobus roseus TaxID=392734 RepID=A0A1H4M0C9_9BACT|nr:hypothetical protein SAMN05443244_1768 [Terriglobus roseus]